MYLDAYQPPVKTGYDELRLASLVSHVSSLCHETGLMKYVFRVKARMHHGSLRSLSQAHLHHRPLFS